MLGRPVKMRGLRRDMIGEHEYLMSLQFAGSLQIFQGMDQVAKFKKVQVVPLNHSPGPDSTLPNYLSIGLSNS